MCQWAQLADRNRDNKDNKAEIADNKGNKAKNMDTMDKAKNKYKQDPHHCAEHCSHAHCQRARREARQGNRTKSLNMTSSQ